MVVGLTTETAAIVLYIFVLAPAKPCKYTSHYRGREGKRMFVLMATLKFLGTAK